MIRIRDISMPPEHSHAQLVYEAAKVLRIKTGDIQKLTLVRRSVDARKKPQVRIIYTVDVAVSHEERILRRSGCKKASISQPNLYQVPHVSVRPERRPVVVGFGPAGMFAALVLAMAGCKPLVLERGEDAQSRHEKVQKFFETGNLDQRSNVQFGEGGAGTFSDGKLNTGVHNPRIGWILERFVEFGAREEILYDAKPHVGTDVLLKVVQNLRKRIIELGGEIRFCTQVTGIQSRNGAITALEIEDGSEILCDCVLFAVGHSARDTFEMLYEAGIPMEAKPFAMGVRIEHLQQRIDLAQYGSDSLPLSPSDYKLVCHLEDTTVYTFCMCPGGYVVAAASEDGKLVTNGMSYADRDGCNANAALLVALNPRDFPGEGPLAGMYWQRQIEEASFRAGGGCYAAPAQRIGDFLAGCPSSGPGQVIPSYRPGVTWCDLRQILPEKITRALQEAIPRLDNQLKGFADPDAVLTAPETRSSSPVRILRGENRQGTLSGFYPAGEGAGYAGGIMSAAIDGMLSAEEMIRQLEKKYGG